MKQKPRHPDEPILNRPMLGVIAARAWRSLSVSWAAFLIGRGTFDRCLIDPSALALARTYAFATLILAELLRSFCARSERISVFRLRSAGEPSSQPGGGRSPACCCWAVVYVALPLQAVSNSPAAADRLLVIVPLALDSVTAAEVGKLIAGLWGVNGEAEAIVQDRLLYQS
jgi:Ca2+-transporting ATPase